jgi:hypothetical protein
MFTSPDFIEDAERSAVFGHIDSVQYDAVYSFAPVENARPLSIFMGKNSEKLAYPNKFWGRSRPNQFRTKLQYNDIVKCELRRSDRRVAQCPENLFFKLNKVQMNIITGRINVAVRKHKTGGQVLKTVTLNNPAVSSMSFI